jgi:Protein of unknown function (DUF2946)
MQTFLKSVPPDKIFFMGFRRLTRCLSAWMACFAILMACLAPSISHAVDAARNSTSFWAEECSVHGEAHNAADHHEHQDAPSHHPTSSHFEHCPFCLTHAASFALLQTASCTLHEVGGFSLFPVLFYQAPRLLFVWVPAQSRAPPAYS